MDAPAMTIRGDDIHVDIDDASILAGCSFDVRAGEVLGLIGPNGSGKSTLLRTVYRAIKPATGALWIGADDVWSLTARQSAQRTAVVTQNTSTDFHFSVAEMVLMGRGPHKGLLDGDTSHDRRKVAWALRAVDMYAFRSRVFSTLSGGEKQRVLVARALAQESRVLVLDEPTNHLDAHAQLDLLGLVRSLQLTTIVALHDLNLAATYCERVCLLDHGRVVGIAPPRALLTADVLRDVFRVDGEWLTSPTTGRDHLALTRSESSTTIETEKP